MMLLAILVIPLEAIVKPTCAFAAAARVVGSVEAEAMVFRLDLDWAIAPTILRRLMLQVREPIWRACRGAEMC